MKMVVVEGKVKTYVKNALREEVELKVMEVGVKTTFGVVA